MELSPCKVTIPQVLIVMLFLWAVHSHYSDLFNQFWTLFKSIELATIDSVVEDITYHNSFTVHERKGGAKPTAAGANLDQKGKKVRQMPFEWLFKTKKEVIKGCWTHALADTRICPICCIKDKPWHVPNLCPLLKKMNLKLDVLPGLSPPAPSPAPAPSPLPGGCVAMVDESATGVFLSWDLPLPHQDRRPQPQVLHLECQRNMILMRIIVGLEMKRVWIMVMSLNVNPPSLVTYPLAIILRLLLCRLLSLLLQIASLYPRLFSRLFGHSASLRIMLFAKHPVWSLLLLVRLTICYQRNWQKKFGTRILGSLLVNEIECKAYDVK
jgi:hypothetical protein